jgi:lipopolysaccharide transport system ATP-binding protein
MAGRQVVLEVSGLSKSYKKSNGENLVALDAISFQLLKGEIVGVLGRNGAGKSTLLKILSQISSPTKGRIEYEGVLSSILDIGTGFHPDLSGRDNVFLSGSLLGLSREQLNAVYEDIVSFSGLEDFMEDAVKNYSSGMYLRLAFAIAFHVQVDILLLDEVIAVGDADFRQKCYEKIRQLRKKGTAVLLVSHQLEPLMEFCDRCILMDRGKIERIGSPLEVIEDYLERLAGTKSGVKIGAALPKLEESKQAVSYHGKASEWNLEGVSFRSFMIEVNGKDPERIDTSDDITIRLEAKKVVAEGSFQVAVELVTMNGQRLLMDSYALRTDFKATEMKEGCYEISCVLPKYLLSKGIYYVGLFLNRNGAYERHLEKVAQFRVEEASDRLPGMETSSLISPRLSWNINYMEE